MQRDHTQVRGLVMDYQAPFEGGALLIANSFWCITRFLTDREQSVLQYWYKCWESVEKYDQGYPPLPGMSKPYQIDHTNYEPATMAVTQGPAGSVIMFELEGLLNANALATKDVTDPDGEMVSFFEHAVPA